MKTLRDFSFKNKRVLVRCDFNVPLTGSGEILDDFRIQKTLPTINYLIEKGAKVILMSHLDKPNGKVVESLRLVNIKLRLMEHLDLSVTKTSDCIGPEIESLTLQMKPGEILLLENLRFHKEEKKGDLDFAKDLSKLGDIFINDAFGSCHRAHASIVGVPKYLPKAAGLLLEEEIKVLTDLMKNPKKPLVTIIGGAKAETKAKLINGISRVADFILVGTLIQKEIKEKGIKIDYPKKIIESVDNIDGKDIGPQAVEDFREKILTAKTIFFNGGLGMIEKEGFSKGTEEILKAIIESKAFSIVGGGEMVEFINKLKLLSEFSHVSTGGGAMLTFLSGERLPGIEALE